jgi:tetratricopeptide (TPR) repeat protein
LFDLYRIPFNGGRGGKALPLPGVSGNGLSNYFPKYSPDGRWIVFCKAKSFMLLQPDSELYIIPAQGGTPRRLACNTARMNSWHTWSPNGKWLVFSSKANSPYTQLFLTHMDEQGNSTPPVLLSWFTAPDRAANIPEFVNVEAGAIRRIQERFVNDYSLVRAARQSFDAGDGRIAARQFHEALALNADNAEAHCGLGVILAKEGKMEEAKAQFQKAVECDAKHVLANTFLADILAHQGELQKAAFHYRLVLQLDPKAADVHNKLGVILATTGDLQAGAAQIAEAVRLKPEDASAQYNLGNVRFMQGEFSDAIPHYAEAVRLDASNSKAMNNLAAALAKSPNPKQELQRLAAEKRLGSDCRSHCLLGDLSVAIGDFESAAACYNRALY